ncbi:hypothetical protein B9N43_13710 [Denitratisoma sp. DHT3]|uniref:MtrB/PioB family decaheme-associated outer membrane protein n=1 Tax=Denitratisoma sp. DHT3 TaxID=1981880 RepID=UPI001198B802|nr:MtrB/PioB family decaheme-associated outer membrane protein [Denitratisoma sp. DHT3]QDX82208.1 hypothetical protein B9N43_13710 [Denitratisoma sp. DHT3]
MTRKIDTRFTPNVLAVSIAFIGFNCCGDAWADDDADDVRRMLRPESEVELGVRHVTATGNDKFGDFIDADTGNQVIANVRVVQRGENDASYFTIDGRNLGLDSRSLKIEGGQQGNFGVRLEYDQLPKLFSDSYQTPFVNPGDTRLVLPAGWVASNATTGMTALATGMRSYDVETLRKSLALGLTKSLSGNWDIAVNFKRDTKEGDRFIGAVIGNSGGNPRAVILPEPVDYTTDQFEATARYTTAKLQLQFGYYGSFFKNANTALSWQNPYANIAGTAWGNPAVGYPLGFGQIGLPPDNQFHQFNASGGYNYSKDTRISGSFSFGRMTQDESFLPYSINSGLLVTTAMPRSSLDGKINTTHADFKITSRLTPKLHFTGSYRYDDRDNKTPQSEYWYIGGDSQNQVSTVPAIADRARVRTNLPGSSTKQQIKADFDYRLTMHTKLKFGYEYDWVKKTFEAISSEREHTFNASVDHRFNDMAAGGLAYVWSDRTTSAYNAGAPFLASYSDPAYIASILPINAADNGLWDNVPTQKKFFLAPRKRDTLRAFANLSPIDRLDLQFSIDHKNDDYYKSELGLRNATGWAANFDASLAATDALTAHMFASWEKYESNQRSAQLGAVKANYLNPGWHWTTDIQDNTFTMGAGLRYKPEGPFEFGGDVTHSDSTGRIRVAVGSLIAATAPALPMPDITSKLNRLDLFGRYWVKKDLSINLKYVYERYTSNDWAYDDVSAATLANVIGTNQASPDYKMHMLGISLSYRFF